VRGGVTDLLGGRPWKERPEGGSFEGEGVFLPDTEERRAHGMHGIPEGSRVASRRRLVQSRNTPPPAECVGGTSATRPAGEDSLLPERGMATKGVRVSRNDCERRFGRTIRSTRRAGLRKTLPARSSGVTPATASRRDRGPELGKGAFAAGAHLTCRRTGRSTDRHESRSCVPAGRRDGKARKGIVGTAGVGVLPKGRVPNPADGEQEGLRFSLLKASPPQSDRL
jgi:hypothetical protein